MSSKPATSYECVEEPGGVLTLPTPSTMTCSSGDSTPPAGIGLLITSQNGTPWGTHLECGVIGSPSHNFEHRAEVADCISQRPPTTAMVPDQVGS